MNIRSSVMLGSQSSSALLSKNFRPPAYHLMNSNKQNINYFRNSKENEPKPHHYGGQPVRRPIFEQKKNQITNEQTKKSLNRVRGEEFRPISAEVRIVSPKNLHYCPQKPEKLIREDDKSVRSRKKSVRFSQNSLQLAHELNTTKIYSQRQKEQKQPQRNRSNSILKNKSSSLQAFNLKGSPHRPKQLSSSTFSISQYKNTLVRERFNQLFKCLIKTQPKDKRYASQRCFSSQQLPNSDINNHYIDPNFPTVNSSIFKNPPSHTKSFKWKRLSQLFKSRQCVVLPQKESNVIIYKEDTSYANINFISVLNLMRSSRALLCKFFQNSVYNEAGIYLIKIFVEYEWKCIIIDDFIPVFQDQQNKQATPLFSRIRQLPDTKPDNVIELWPLLLEKAYATALGSYEAAHQGDSLLEFCHKMGLPVHKIRIDFKHNDWQEEFKANYNEESIIYGYSKSSKEKKEEKLPYRLKNESQKAEKKEDTIQYLQFQQIQTKMTIKMSMNHFKKSFQELMIIKLSTLTHITTSNVIITSRYRSRTNQRLILNQNQPSKQQKKPQIRREKPIIKSFILSSHQEISLILKTKKKGKQWLRVFIFMKQLDSFRWIEGKYSCESLSFSSALEPGQYYIVILPDWTINAENQLFLMIYSRINCIVIQNHTESNPQSMIEKGCCDYVQRFGKMIQVNRWICTYAVVHREAGIVIENINNQHRKGKVKIFRSIENLNPTGCNLFPLNEEFYSKGQLKTEVELSLQKDQSYSVVLLLFGGTDSSFLSTFNFGV